MAIQVRPDPQKFAVGQSMAAYAPPGGWQPERPTGPPPGVLVETQTVAAGGIATYNGLMYGTEYVGYGSSPDRYWRFEASSAPVSSSTGAGLPSNVVTTTTAYTAAAGDLVQADLTAAGFTVTMPSNANTGALVAVKKIDATANTLTISAAGGTVDGSATTTTVTQWAGLILEHIGSDVWRVVSSMTTTGPAGPTGPQGIQGVAGPTGPAGSALNVLLPGDHGFLTMSCDPATAQTNASVGLATIYCVRLPVKSGFTVTNLLVYINGGAAGMTNCYCGIYKLDGTQIATTADQSSNWATTGLKTMPLTAASGQTLVLPANADVIAGFQNGNVANALPLRGQQASATMANVGTASPAFRISTAAGGNAALPTTMPTQTAGTQQIWMALS